MNQQPTPRTAPVVLIADDDSDIRELLRRFLARDGYTFVEANDGVSALAVFESAQPDIVLLDILMPLIDGVEVCARIQALPHSKHVPVLMVTVLNNEQLIERAFEAGATDYITKPIDLTVLRQRVRRLLRARYSEAELRDSESRLRSIVSISADAIILVDTDRHIRLFNPSAEKIFGYRVDEVIGQPLDQLLPDRSIGPDRLYQLESSPSSTIGEYASVRLETVGRRKDGAEFLTEATIGQIEIEGERMFAVTVRDITERVRAEEEIRRLNDDLRRRAGELAALNNASRAMVSSLNLQRVLAVVVNEIRNLLVAEGALVLLRDPVKDELVLAAAAGNEGAEHLVGVRVPIISGIAGRVVRERQTVVVNDAQRDPRFQVSLDAVTGVTTRSVMATPLTYKGAAWGVIEVVNKLDGSFSNRDSDILEALARSASIAIENARLYQSEREHFRRLQDSQTRLIHSEKMSALGRLVASLAHEINNPLQSIQTCLSLVIEELAGEFEVEDVRRDLEIADSAVRRISAIMDQMRDLYRPIRVELQLIDVHAILENVLRLTSNELEHQDIVVKCSWASNLPTIQANPDRLNQVFLNMVINAMDAMPHGGTLHVITSLSAPDNHGQISSIPSILIQFNDTGEGIPADAVSRIFEPFYTTKESGTGLGLAISYEFIKSLGGDITVTSQVGVGTTFTIKLPVHIAESLMGGNGEHTGDHPDRRR